MNARVTLYEGANILFPEGPRIVVAVGPFGYTVRDVTGGVHEVSWTDVQPARAIVDGRVDAVAESLMAVLSGLSDDALQESLDKQEVVLCGSPRIVEGFLMRLPGRGPRCSRR